MLLHNTLFWFFIWSDFQGMNGHHVGRGPSSGIQNVCAKVIQAVRLQRVKINFDGPPFQVVIDVDGLVEVRSSFDEQFYDFTTVPYNTLHFPDRFEARNVQFDVVQMRSDLCCNDQKWNTRIKSKVYSPAGGMWANSVLKGPSMVGLAMLMALTPNW